MLWGSRAVYAATMAFASTLVVVSASGQQAFAQEGTVALDTITVTGEKIERDIMETASSVSVISAEDLAKKQSAATVADAINDIPNVVYPGTVGAPIIRGQDTQGSNFGSTAFFGGTIPRATVNLDGHYSNFYELVYGGTSIWDVKSIEVFRGPQTTTQGANAIAGAIIVNTNDPTFNTEGAYQVEVGNYDKRRTSLMVNRPIIDNELAARFTLDYWSRSTFIDYTNPTFATGDNGVNFKTLNGRAKLLWTPTDIPSLTAKLTYAHTYNSRPTYEAASVPYEDLKNRTGSMPAYEQDTDSGVLDLSYDLGGGIKLFNQSQISSSHIARTIIPETLGAATIDQENITNEARVTYGDVGSRLSGVTGVFIAHTTSEDWLNNRGISSFDDEKLNVGIYTESTYKLTDRWTLTGGLRYQRDNTQRWGSSAGFAPGVYLNFDETYDAWLPKVSLAYEVIQDVTVGVLFNKGYTPGGVNLSFANSKYLTFDPETVNNYELFTRAKLFDNKLTLTGNIFYADYSNAQRLQDDYLGSILYGAIVVNADSAEAYGLEVSGTYQLRDDFRIRAGAGLLHTRISEYTDAAGDAVNEGNKFGNAPGYTLSAGIDWDIIEKVKWSIDVRHTDGYYSADDNNPLYHVDNFTVANSRISYDWTDNTQLYAYVNNIFDERTPLWKYQDRSIGGVAANMLEPRMIGVGIKGTF